MTELLPCPRCHSKNIDDLLDKYGRSKNEAMYGKCEYKCRNCDYMFTRSQRKDGTK